MGAVVLAGQLLRGLTAWVRTAQSELIRDHLSGLIQKKSLEVDLAFYDSSDFYDHLHRARMEAAHQPVELLEGLGSLLQGSITMAAILAILIPFGPLPPLALLLSMAPALYVVVRLAQRRHQWHQRTTIDNRRAWYYDTLLTDGEKAAEIRLYDVGGHFLAAYQKVRRRLRQQRLRAGTGRRAYRSCGPGRRRCWFWPRPWRGWCCGRFAGGFRWAIWRCSTRRTTRATDCRERCWTTWASCMRTACSWAICSSLWI